MSGGWSAAESRIRNLGKKAEIVDKGKLISVVYMDENGEIDWPENPAPGVLIVPSSLTIEQWTKQYG